MDKLIRSDRKYVKRDIDISTEELCQQLPENFPSAMNVFAKALGVSVHELTQAIQRGSLLDRK